MRDKVLEMTYYQHHHGLFARHFVWGPYDTGHSVTNLFAHRTINNRFEPFGLWQDTRLTGINGSIVPLVIYIPISVVWYGIV